MRLRLCELNPRERNLVAQAPRDDSGEHDGGKSSDDGLKLRIGADAENSSGNERHCFCQAESEKLLSLLLRQ
jgi:hypothetical protein